jgi:ABC-type branched-subunit amino acid transport system substrate-binding protein
VYRQTAPRTGRGRGAGWILVAAALAGCGGGPTSDDGIPIGLMLSYTGYLAANSVNSERALWMAVEAVNSGGGVGGKPLRIVARDTRSDVQKVREPAQELIDAGVVAFIGPDTNDLVNEVRPLILDRTVMLPSFNTASQVFYKPTSWFDLGGSTITMSCEISNELQADGRTNPLVIFNPTGYTNSLAWYITNRFGFKKMVLPTDASSTREAIGPIIASGADSFVLAAVPSSAAALLNALAVQGGLDDPSRWYLSPTLHNRSFLEAIPHGALEGARGVAPMALNGADAFRARFVARWQDEPLDDAFVFYDTGAVVALALQRALTQHGAFPAGTGLGEHLMAVTRAGATGVRWDEIDRGLELLRDGHEVTYLGLSGRLAIDDRGQTSASATAWWHIENGGFTDVPDRAACQ